MPFDFRKQQLSAQLLVEGLVKKSHCMYTIYISSRMWNDRYRTLNLLLSYPRCCALALLGALSSSCYGRHWLSAITILIATQSAYIHAYSSPRQAQDVLKPTTVLRSPVPPDLHAAPLIHFVFLVHGYKGKSTDLSYLQANLRKRMEQRASSLLPSPSPSPTLVIHNAVSNENQTMDGVQQGGERLFREILHTIRTHVQHEIRLSNINSSRLNVNHGSTHVTLSIIGNSLGGIYSRYAVAKLAAMSTQSNNDMDQPTSSFPIDQGLIRIHYNVFCTTASPHLGISRHTWLKLPRFLEVFIAYLLGDTGRDLYVLYSFL